MAGQPSQTGGRLRDLVRLAARGAYRGWAQRPIDVGSVFLESFQGSGARGNPAAIFQRMRSDPRFSNRHYFWAVDPANFQRMSSVFADQPSVRLLRYGSGAYFRALSTSEILINNVTFPALFTKRPDQFYLNTWHGTPLKRMGKDALGAAPIGNTVANFAMADVLLSTCDYMTQTMYRDAYEVADCDRKVCRLGYPRIDAQFDRMMFAVTRAALAEAGMDATGRRVVLYAPTWRESGTDGVANDAAKILRTLDNLRATTDPCEFRLLARLHPKVVEQSRRVPGLARYLVPDTIDTNALLGVTDVLVTDYSSVFFDFLATGTRVLFYVPDEHAYQKQRGLYLGSHELPGPVTGDLAQLAKWLAAPPTTGFLEPAAARARYCPDEDGSATLRVLDLLSRI